MWLVVKNDEVRVRLFAQISSEFRVPSYINRSVRITRHRTCTSWIYEQASSVRNRLL